jgi:PKD repeat protein
MTNKRMFTTLLATSASLALAASAQAAPGWTPATNLSVLSDTNSDVLTDVTPAGDSVVMARDAINSGKYGFRVSLRHPGAPFSKQVLPSGGSALVQPFADGDVDLAAGGRGIAAWDQSNGLFYALRSLGGAFGAAQEVTGLPTASISSIKVGLDNAGNATLLWTTTTGTFPSFTSHVYAIQRRVDGTFVNPQTLAVVNSSDFTSQAESVDVNAAGAAVVGWREAGPGIGDVHYSFRNGALSPLGGVVTTTGAFAVDGAIDTAGDTAVAMATLNGLQVRYKPAGGALPAPTTIGTANGPPRVAMAGNGTATVLWQTKQGANTALLACSFTTAGCLKPVTTVTTDPASIGDAQIAITSGGAAVALWSSDPFGVATVRARMRTAGGAWGVQQTIGPVHSTFGSVGIDDAGNAVGAWRFTGAKGMRLQAAEFDVTAPKLSAVVPTKAVAGTTVKMSATASDNWGPVALNWAFGDGVTAKGGLVSHTYGVPATRTITVTARDAAGNTTSQTHLIKIGPKPATATSGH